MVKLNGWYSQHVDIEVHEQDIVDAVIQIVKKKHKLENVDGLDKGRMVEHCEYATSHSWVSKEDRGVPTELQKNALMVIEELKTLRHG